ncbi:hypothetical protein [Burkholderia glumae]|uniref:hypothetical protein n=1 Tax=Burkholderia glumae TaxID=337 RepID=UPI00265EEEC3|nr:hypothetical protein [Burkholderia glumae]
MRRHRVRRPAPQPPGRHVRSRGAGGWLGTGRSAPAAAHAAKLDGAAPLVAAAALAPVALVEGRSRRAAAKARAKPKPRTAAPRHKASRA